jgi:hypothetical protein
VSGALCVAAALVPVEELLGDQYLDVRDLRGALVGAHALGVIAGVVCFYAVALKNKLGWDDALDVWGVHGMGGLLGIVLLGVFASTAVNPACMLELGVTNRCANWSEKIWSSGIPTGLSTSS